MNVAGRYVFVGAFVSCQFDETTATEKIYLPAIPPLYHFTIFKKLIFK